MPYAPKHAALRVPSLRARVMGVAAVGSASIIATLAPSAPAQAASNVWDRVARCESGGNWSINTGNGYYGGLQFSRSSWRAAGGTRFASLPHRASRAEQIATAQVLLRKQGPRAWPHCGPRAGLTRSNGLAASGGGAIVSKKKATKKVNQVRSGRTTWASRAQIRTVQSWLGNSRTGKWSVADVRDLQRVVRARVDGIVGRETVRKTESFLKTKRTSKSYFTPATLRALHRYAVKH